MSKYDRLTANQPPEQPHQIGHEEDDTCGRYPEEDEDQPRGYRLKPCDGVMVQYWQGDRQVECNTCSEIGD